MLTTSFQVAGRTGSAAARSRASRIAPSAALLPGSGSSPSRKDSVSFGTNSRKLSSGVAVNASAARTCVPVGNSSLVDCEAQLVFQHEDAPVLELWAVDVAGNVGPSVVLTWAFGRMVAWWWRRRKPVDAQTR